MLLLPLVGFIKYDISPPMQPFFFETNAFFFPQRDAFLPLPDRAQATYEHPSAPSPWGSWATLALHHCYHYSAQGGLVEAPFVAC